MYNSRISIRKEDGKVLRRHLKPDRNVSRKLEDMSIDSILWFVRRMF